MSDQTPSTPVQYPTEIPQELTEKYGPEYFQLFKEPDGEINLDKIRQISKLVGEDHIIYIYVDDAKTFERIATEMSIRTNWLRAIQPLIDKLNDQDFTNWFNALGVSYDGFLFNDSIITFTIRMDENPGSLDKSIAMRIHSVDIKPRSFHYSSQRRDPQLDKKYSLRLLKMIFPDNFVMADKNEA